MASWSEAEVTLPLCVLLLCSLFWRREGTHQRLCFFLLLFIYRLFIDGFGEFYFVSVKFEWSVSICAHLFWSEMQCCSVTTTTNKSKDLWTCNIVLTLGVFDSGHLAWFIFFFSGAAADLTSFFWSILTQFIRTLSCDFCFYSVTESTQNVTKYNTLGKKSVRTKVNAICYFHPYIKVYLSPTLSHVHHVIVFFLFSELWNTTCGVNSIIFLCPSPQLYLSERCQKQIDEVLQGKERASFDDRHQMPYVQVCHQTDFS